MTHPTQGGTTNDHRTVGILQRGGAAGPDHPAGGGVRGESLGPGSGSTRKLRSGYPTDPLTIRREGGAASAAGTEHLPEDPAQPGTVRLVEEAEDGTAVLPEEETTPLPEGPSPKGTVPLAQEKEPEHLEVGTMVFSESEGSLPSSQRERGE